MRLKCTCSSSYSYPHGQQYPGAGIYADGRTVSTDPERPIANNSLIVSGSDGLRLECVSNSSQSGVGMITGLDGNTFPFGNTGVWRVVNPFSRPGVLRLQTISTTTSLPAADQGIYTCIIPDSNDNFFIFNVGLYPSGFMGGLLHRVFTVIILNLSQLFAVFCMDI